MPTTALHSLDDFGAGIAAHPRVLLFKHSPACPISAAARGEWEAFLRAEPDVPALFVDVIADRDVARALAAQCGVRHESPQAILFVAGRPVWHESHGRVTEAALRSAWTAYAGRS